DRRPSSVGADGGRLRAAAGDVHGERAGALVRVANRTGALMTSVSTSRVSGRQRAVAERTQRSIRARRVRSSIMVGLMYVAAVIAILPLILIIIHLLRLGGRSINFAFFTQMPRPPGEHGGGMANAIVGTLILIGIASAVGLPVGIGAGLYLAEKRTTLL